MIAVGRSAPLLEAALPHLDDTLRAVTDDTARPLVVTDARGRVLWHDDRHPAPHRHRWTPAARSVREPDGGEVVGAVDVAGPADGLHPTTRALVAAAARLIESHLTAQQVARSAGRTPGGC